MAQLIVICIAFLLVIVETWIVGAGIMSIWSILIANGMFSGFHVTSMLLKGKVKVEDAKDIKTYEEARRHWLASTLVMSVPAMFGIAIILYVIPLTPMGILYGSMIVLGMSVYAMITLAIGNWSNLEID